MSAFDLPADYRSTLDRGLSVSGESSDHFARRRVDWLVRRLVRGGHARPRRVLDIGCGDGRTMPLLLDAWDAEDVLGVDESSPSIEAARSQARNPRRLRFETSAQYVPSADRELAYCNGVMHHVPPDERDAFLGTVHDALTPRGWLALFENNPWNPGAMWVMRRLPFDRDAIPLDVVEAKRRVRRAGLYVVAVDFLFVFPRFLRALRPTERALSRYPLGAQYLVLARKP